MEKIIIRYLFDYIKENKMILEKQYRFLTRSINDHSVTEFYHSSIVVLFSAKKTKISYESAGQKNTLIGQVDE